MKVYNYHPDFKYFLYEEDARQSPLDPPGTWLIPANATDVAPPETKEKELAVWNGESWEIEIIKDEPQKEPEKYCPLIGRECIKSSCAWFINDDCAITSLPSLLQNFTPKVN